MCSVLFRLNEALRAAPKKKYFSTFNTVNDLRCIYFIGGENDTAEHVPVRKLFYLFNLSLKKKKLKGVVSSFQISFLYHFTFILAYFKFLDLVFYRFQYILVSLLYENRFLTGDNQFSHIRASLNAPPRTFVKMLSTWKRF